MEVYKITRVHDILDTSLTALKQPPLNEAPQAINFFGVKVKGTMV